ncbi:uncharacterized protein LOC128992485 isoform X1 [Macrosteles quadrilineatus]|uniref:uncharacterized protein LOC128992485 isoform X1 n=1 Tax=Macrosteles quadrilineatus TaxID=74068 RepID=UPI0023E347E9|nr:uncharacterized protein LOC128992485 isoform X1 [Macrosteles quadrilineatus]
MSSLKAAAVLSVSLCLLSCTKADTQNCVDYNNDVLYKADDMEGTWYPIEIVIHRNDSKIYGVPLDTNCPAVTLTKGPKKTLVMMWNSTEGDLEYRFQQKGRGQWQSISDQKGSLAGDNYKQYGGIFRVFKMDDDYMFLSYCSKNYRVLNTVAFSKSGTMPPELIDETLKELEDRKIKRSRQIRVPPCEEGGYSHRILSSCLLSILPSLVVRFPL